MCYSLFMGRLGGHGHGGGHGGAGHGIGHGAGHGIGHGAGHGIGHSAGHAVGHGAGAATGHGAASAHVAGHGAGHGASHGTIGNQGASHGAGHNTASGASQNADCASEAGALALQQFSTGQATPLRRFHIPGQSSGLVELVLEFLNPMVLATFMTYFGLTGLILHFTVPALGLISLIPSALVGIIVTRVLLFVMHWMFAKMEVNSVAVVENLIGTFATVTLPVVKDRVGEITYVVESKRFTAPAKPLDAVTEFKRGAGVMISEIRNNIMYIEPWTDSFEP
jgi:hypothetical protein